MHNISQMIFLKWIVSVLIGIITVGCSAEINPKTQAIGTKEHNRINETESSAHNSYKNDESKKGESMKFSRKLPENWFWSHDIDPNYIDDVLLLGMHLIRLSVYGSGKKQHFTAVSFRESGIESVYLQDVAAAKLENKIANIEAYPISITADEIDGQPYFSDFAKRIWA